ncbi:hypothetical protein C8R44DRAFT_976022, partial [Mycena epipterygia]
MGLSSSTMHTTAVFDGHIADLILGLVVPGACLTFLVLCCYAYLAWHPVSKGHLNRVSFRLLVYALIANLIFGISFLIGTLATAPSTWCTFVAFLVNLSLMFSGGMFFCMALNLQLVLVHRFNGQRMEKYYILGTSLLCAACNITPYAYGQFGWNAINETCWFRNPDQAVMLRWLIGTQSFWVLLMAASEVVAFLAIVGYVISYELITRRYRSRSDSSVDYYPDNQIPPKSPVILYRKIILRIGLYPLVSCLMNFSTCILDLYQVKNPILTELNWRLAILDLAIYSVRPLIYGVLAATDPAFIRAILALRRPVETRSIEQGVAFQLAVLGSVTNVHVELQPVDRSHTDEEVGSAKWSSTDSRGPTQTITSEARVPPIDSSKTQAPTTRSVGALHSRTGSGIDLAYHL